MNKLVIHTQYLENYGDSKDPYMKFKGGTTYVMSNCGELNEKYAPFGGGFSEKNLIEGEIL